jgi:Protein of unknown function (DUF1572)
MRGHMGAEPKDDLLRAFSAEYANLRTLADRAAAQLDDHAFFAVLSADGNSVALLMKHVGGNLRSRWTDIFTTDGEKPDRQRDREFELEPQDSRASIEAVWAGGWDAVLDTLAGLTTAELLSTVRVRGEPMTVARALTRSLAHTAGHVHQIILLARHWQGDRWQTLSIPRGRSEQFLQQMLQRDGAGARPDSPPLAGPDRRGST